MTIDTQAPRSRHGLRAAMQIGDMVYYWHTDKNGFSAKYPAVVHTLEADSARIRIGRMDVLTQRIMTADFVVDTELLTERGTRCSYEDELCAELDQA